MNKLYIIKIHSYHSGITFEYDNKPAGSVIKLLIEAKCIKKAIKIAVGLLKERSFTINYDATVQDSSIDECEQGVKRFFKHSHKKKIENDYFQEGNILSFSVEFLKEFDINEFYKEKS